MSVLELPPQLRGPWEHALIMTYGFDVDFFEQTLLPLFAPECRNKIVLVNGTDFLDICARLANNGEQLLYFNQAYLVSGIFAPRTAHAKVILLASRERGRLLVGSGNTSLQGYASGGELFTLYEYSKETPESLPAFLAVWKLIEQLVDRQYEYVQGQAIKQRLDHLRDNTPWLWQRNQIELPPVRHTLNASFLAQIKQFVGDEAVEELWVLAPFFDERAAALAELVEAVRPARTILLLQSAYVSVDRLALQHVLDHLPGHWEIRPLQAKDGPVWIHAKLYLFKLADRALCVQGSPNMSQVAMLLHIPQGNIEVANFLVGPRDAFDDVLAELPLIVGPPQIDLSGLELVYQKKESEEEGKKQAGQLLAGEWQHDRLQLHTRGMVPDLSEALLIINGQAFPLILCNTSDQMLELTLPEAAREQLTRHAFVSIRWNEGAEVCETNPIIPCDRATIDRILQQEEQHSEQLERSADLDLDDQGFEELLGELHETLVIDQDSIWNAARGQTSSQKVVPDDKGQRLSYEDVDYEALRLHPKIRQYLERGSETYGSQQSRISIIMSAISRAMQKLLQQVEMDYPALAQALVPSSEEAEDEPFVEEEPERKEDASARHWSVRARIRRRLLPLLDRYLRGLASSSFQQLVGYEVVAKNYLILSQVLYRLFSKDWLESDEIIDTLIQSWRLFWGSQAIPGYFYQLSVEEQLEIWEWMRKYGNDSLILATYYYGAMIVIKEQREDLRFSLRDSLRDLLSLSPFPLITEVLDGAQKLLASLLPYRPPNAMEMMKELDRLAYFETQRHFKDALVAEGLLPAGSFSFRKDSYQRERYGPKVFVDCLVIESSAALSSKEKALSLLQVWMQAQQLDYYRIISKEPNDVQEYRYLIFYDMKEQRGKYAVRGEDDRPHAQEIPQIYLPVRLWETGLKHLGEIVQQVTSAGNVIRKDKKLK